MNDKTFELEGHTYKYVESGHKCDGCSFHNVMRKCQLSPDCSPCNDRYIFVKVTDGK